MCGSDFKEGMCGKGFKEGMEDGFFNGFFVGVLVALVSVLAVVKFSEPSVSNEELYRFCMERKIGLDECRIPEVDNDQP